MAVDLSYLTELPSEAQEKAVQQAVQFECIRAIVTYLTEVADTLDAHKIETINAPSLRAMAAELSTRLAQDEEN